MFMCYVNVWRQTLKDNLEFRSRMSEANVCDQINDMLHLLSDWVAKCQRHFKVITINGNVQSQEGFSLASLSVKWYCSVSEKDFWLTLSQVRSLSKPFSGNVSVLTDSEIDLPA